MKIKLVRGKFLNPFELQNFYPLSKNHQITAISSKRPINSKIKLPLVKLYFPADLPEFPYKYSILNRIFKDAHHLYNLKEKIKGADIVHVAETYYYYTKQAVEAKKQDLVSKIISTVWETIPHNNETLPGRKNIKQLSYKHVNHFLAVTDKAKEALIKEGVEDKKITSIPMGVDIQKFSPSTEPSKQKDIRILFVGRIVPQKGIPELIETFNKLKRNHQNLRLVVLGNGPLRREIIGAGAELKKVDYENIHQEYKKADIFTLLSKPTNTWEEQFGMVLV